MITAIDFTQELHFLRTELQLTRDELVVLKAQRTSIETQPLALLLDELLTLDAGKLPGVQVEQKPTRKKRASNGEKGRRRQIKVICRALGADGMSFGTSDIYRQFGRQDVELTAGIKSYISSSMQKFVKDGFLQKLGRGQWELASTSHSL